jgi:hypothetical protein
LNIFTIPYGSKGFYCRPDTSLNKDSNDYFCPDSLTELAAAVFIYARASKAGKSVAAKFAPRYYNIVGKGVHFTAPQMICNDSPETWWTAHSLDNSTFLLDSEDNASAVTPETIEQINAAFETVSKYVSFRTGDYIAIEIGPSTIVANGNNFKFEDKEINIIW